MAKRKPNGQPNDDDSDDDEAPFTDQQLEVITRTVNASVTAQITRKLPSAIEQAVAPQFATLNETLAKLVPQQPGANGQPANAGAGNAGAGSPQPTKDPEVEQLRSKLSKIEEERKTEREAVRAQERDGKLRELLSTAGVEPNRMKGAIAVLRESMKYDPKANDGAGGWQYIAKRDGYDEPLALDAGVKEWTNTDEGKSYLAATTTRSANGGAGTTRRTVVPGAGAAAAVRGSKPVNGTAAGDKTEKRVAAASALSEGIDALFAGGNIDI